MHPKIPRREIARLTAQAFGVNKSDLDGMSRDQDICRARFAAWMLIKFYWYGHPLSTPFEIAGAIGGGRDRTTILSGQGKAARLLFRDHAFQLRIREARRLINAYTPREWTHRPIFAPALVAVARNEEPPPATQPEASKPKTSRQDTYSVWLRQTCEGSEARFLDIAKREFPHLVRVPQKEAAE